MKPRFSHEQTRALTLTEVLVIIVVVIFLVGFLFPALEAAKRKAQRIACVSNLKQIGMAFRLWEGDNGDKYPMQVSVTNGGAMEVIGAGNADVLWQTMSNEFRSPKILLCPADTGRIVQPISQSLSVTPTSVISSLWTPLETYPQMILDGDDNLLVEWQARSAGHFELSDRHHHRLDQRPASWQRQHRLWPMVHVNQITSHGPELHIVADSVATNRWLIP